MSHQLPVPGQPAAARMPMPPSIVGILLLSMGGGFWAIGLLFLLLGWLTEARGVSYFAYFWLGLVVLLSVVFAWAYARYRKTLPNEQLAFCPAPYGQDFQLSFVAPNGKLYLWLNLDVSSEIKQGGQMLLLDVQLGHQGQWRPVAPLAFLWRGEIRSELSSRVPEGRKVVAVTMNEHNQRRHGVGRFRCIARVAELGDIHPGQNVSVRGRLHSADVAIHQLTAEAFVVRA